MRELEMKNTKMTVFFSENYFGHFYILSERVHARIRARSSHCSGTPGTLSQGGGRLRSRGTGRNLR